MHAIEDLPAVQNILCVFILKSNGDTQQEFKKVGQQEKLRKLKKADQDK